MRKKQESRRGSQWISLFSEQEKNKWESEVLRQGSQKKLETLKTLYFLTFSDFISASFNKRISEEREEYWVKLVERISPKDA